MTETQRPLTAREFAAVIVATVMLVIAAGIATNTNPVEYAWESVAMVVRGTWDAIVSLVASLFA